VNQTAYFNGGAVVVFVVRAYASSASRMKSTLDTFHLNEWCYHEKTKRKSTTLEETVPLECSNRAGLWTRAMFELTANGALR